MENQPAPLPSTTPPTGKPKGILKNAPPLTSNNSSNHLTWDEENLAATEIGKDSLMKITEPKTPYVRYDAETDTVEGMSDIPPFTLEPQSQTPSAPNSPLPVPTDITDPAKVAAVTNANTSANAAISASGDGVRRNSATRPGSNSRTSSRSTSFNLPNDDPTKAKLRTSRSPENHTADDGEIEEEEDDPEAAAKHAEFVKARGRHYSNEAEAMKRAARLLAEEDEEEDSSAQEKETTETEGEDSMEQDNAFTDSPAEGARPKPNGISHS